MTKIAFADKDGIGFYTLPKKLHMSIEGHIVEIIEHEIIHLALVKLFSGRVSRQYDNLFPEVRDLTKWVIH